MDSSICDTILAACHAARSVLHIVPSDETRPMAAVNAAETWARNPDSNGAPIRAACNLAADYAIVAASEEEHWAASAAVNVARAAWYAADSIGASLACELYRVRASKSGSSGDWGACANLSKRANRAQEFAENAASAAIASAKVATDRAAKVHERFHGFDWTSTPRTWRELTAPELIGSTTWFPGEESPRTTEYWILPDGSAEVRSSDEETIKYPPGSWEVRQNWPIGTRWKGEFVSWISHPQF